MSTPSATTTAGATSAPAEVIGPDQADRRPVGPPPADRRGPADDEAPGRRRSPAEEDAAARPFSLEDDEAATRRRTLEDDEAALRRRADQAAARRRSLADDEAPRREEQAAGGREDGAPKRPGDIGETHISFWDDEATKHFRSKWHEVKADFVDDPVAALTRAHDLLTDAVNELTESLLAERDELDPLSSTATPDTESMRMAMRGYREFLDRILSL